jgi:AraC-like DNA-binding protein/ligand-binding sensor protein
MQTVLVESEGALEKNIGLPDAGSLAALAPAETTPSDRTLLEALVNSQIYREYERAFNDLTGLPIALQPVETWQLPHHGKRNENPFCALLSAKSSACAGCLQTREKLCQQVAADKGNSVECPAGLCDSAVPIRISDRLIGYLQTGQVFRKKPTELHFKRVQQLCEKWGMDSDPEELRKAFFSGKVVSVKDHDSVIKLLTIFAQHLSMLSNEVFIQRKNAEPPAIIKARNYIHEHQMEKLSLEQVARAANMSSYYFCKMFKKVVGINFTDYVARVRIEKSKNLLLNPNLRVSEIAFEVGFQSLTHFNRIFKKILGQSPTEYRAHLLSL